MPKIENEKVRLQYGALPYRWTAEGRLQVLMITSRTTRRWIVPKGWPIKGCKPWETAEIEARQEAGVSGAIAKRTAGSFRYSKLIDEDGRVVPCEVKVFPLLVKRSLKAWPEMAQREARWLPATEAAALAADEGLRSIIAAFEPPRPKRAHPQQTSPAALGVPG